MAQFAFKAYSASGSLESGDLVANSRAAALDALTDRGLTPFEVTETNGPNPTSVGPWWNREIRLFTSGYDTESLQGFLFGLSTMLCAGLTLIDALKSVSEDIKDQRLAGLVKSVLLEVENGAALSDALSPPGGEFPQRIASLIRIGEASNQLPLTVTRAAEMLAREIAFGRELKSALTYPMILFVASVAVILGLIFFLAPALAPVFASVRADPPWMIQSMLNVKSGLQQNGWIVALGAFLVFAAIVRGARQRPAWVEPVVLRLPLLGPVLQARESGQVLMTLALMLESGAALLPSLEAARETCRFKKYRILLEQAESGVRAGDALSATLGESLLFAPEARRMIRLGESSNRLATLLKSAADASELRMRIRLQDFLRLLTPLMTILIGGLIGALIFSTLSAILEINELAF